MNKVCLSAHEVMLRIVKLLRSEVSADVSGTLHFTLYEVQHFTAASPQLHFARSAKLHGNQYAHGKTDFIAKLQIALKKANETGYWLELLYKTGYISEAEYKILDSSCTL